MLRKIITAILVLVVMIAGTGLEFKLNEYRIADTIKTETSKEMRSGRDVDFDKLLGRNSDVKGWIYLPDSNIDYPVVQRDNSYYLHRDIDGNYLYDGMIFIDESNEDPFSDFNTVIYGHHMFSGAMFYDLNKFADEKYFRKHNVFQIETPDGSYDLHIIAYLNEPSGSDIYTTHFLDPFDDNTYFSESDFIELINTKAKILDGDFDVSDRFVTLSTCAYNYDEARHQVIGILEEPALVDVIRTTRLSGINKWLCIQIGIGILILGTIILTLTPRREK